MATKEIKNFALEGKHGDRGRVVLHLMSGPNNMVYAVLSSLVFADKARKDKPAELAHPFQTPNHRASVPFGISSTGTSLYFGFGNNEFNGRRVDIINNIRLNVPKSNVQSPLRYLSRSDCNIPR